MKKLLLMGCALVLTGLFSQTQAQTAKFKALFIYNFAMNGDWPASDQMVITVLGDSEMITELESIAKVKKVGNRTMVIKSASSVKDIEDSQIIYVGSSKCSLMPIVASYQKNNPVLLIADKGGMCGQGAGIAFTSVDGKLRFEINEGNIEAHKIKISQKVVSLGISVN